MIILDRIELADAFTPKELVVELFKQCPKLTPPIPIEELARAAGIKEILSLDSKLIEGMLVADEGKDSGVIFYNRSNRPIGRQRFTIGHELGHFLLLHHNGNMTCDSADVSFSSYSENEIEKEANEFAQLLLLPDKMIQEEFENTSLSIQTFQDTSNLFKMSFEATANKCTKFGERPFALVYSKDDRVRYCWKDHKRFPYYNLLKKGSLLPRSSQAMTLTLPEQTITSFHETACENWFKTSSNYQLPITLIEQTFFQNDGFKVTLLFEE